MPSRNRVTLSDIAERSGVSQSTVSLVLHDKPGVGDETRQTVLKVAKELGYLPKKNTKRKLNISNVGLILKSEPDTFPQDNQFYTRVLAGIEAACRQWQMNLLYSTLQVDRDSQPVEIPRMLTDENTTEALLFVGAFLSDTLIQVTARQSVPVVLVDAYAASDLYDAVISDNHNGAYQATSYLIDKGHRHIGFVGCHPKAYPSILERREGYSQALRDHHIDRVYCGECHIIDREEIFTVTSDLLERHPEITALLCANDEVAISVMEAAQDLGLRIPEDLSVFGFDNIRAAQMTTPPLTTMHIDKFGMGNQAIQLLINRVEHPQSNPVTSIIHPNLIERSSIANKA